MEMKIKRSLPVLSKELRLVAWEVTRRCNLACVHCRASSEFGPYEAELDGQEAFELIEQIARVGKPVVILTGGEPLLRPDIFEIAARGNERGLRMVLATNGTLLTEATVRRMIDSGIQRVSVSLDGPDAESHDAFRSVPGAFDGAMAGIDALKKAGMDFQINTTVSRANNDDLGAIMDLAVNLGAAAHHIFLLVPTGRGKYIADQEMTAEEYEKTLHRFYEQSCAWPIPLKATCAPHYHRISRQRQKERPAAPEPAGEHPFHSVTRGCLGGSSFCFISHRGQVQPCGYLEIDCGQVRERPFEAIWNESVILKELRDLNLYKGKCGRCEFIGVCGGCRARAYESTGDYLAEEPLCIYEPRNS
ncbi:MAG: heme b synthase [Deltaproteobacteria bacterium]|nr:heme b synthase [Deltaproteobacteria bacterium]